MIRIPNRVIALVLAVTMLLSATSLTTFADDSDYNDSGYSDSGTSDYDEVDGLLPEIIKLQPRMLMAAPPTADFEYLTQFASSSNKETPLNETWTVPSAGSYKFHVIGAGGNGSNGCMGAIRYLSNSTQGCIWGQAGAGGGSGGQGGYSILQVELKEGTQILVNYTSSSTELNIPSYGFRVIANGGQNAVSNIKEADPKNSDRFAYISKGGAGGTATGGNICNLTGANGKDGDRTIQISGSGVNAIGGNGADACQIIHPLKKYQNIKDAELPKGGVGAKPKGDGVGDIGTHAGDSPCTINPPYGLGQAAAGGGGAGFRVLSNVPKTSEDYKQGLARAGMPGGIIIEKMKFSPPTVSQSYNPSTNKATITAYSPEATSIQILKNGVVISTANGNTTTCEVAANGLYIAKAVQGIATQTTDFNVAAIDDAAPNITYIPLPTGWARSKSTTITLTDAKTPSGMQYQINGGAWTNYTAPFYYNFTANGSITVNARDKWGNPSSTTTITANQIDTTPPTPPVITKEPPTIWHKDDVTVTISGGSDTGSGIKGYQYQIDGGNWQDYTAPFVVDKSAKINARTVDNVGLVSQPTAADVNIDRIKPTGTITYDKAWTKDSVELTFTASDLGGSGVQHVRPEGAGSWTDGDTVKHSVSTNGSHSFEVEDNASNPETVSAEINNIDKIPPVIEEINFVKTNDNLVRSIMNFFNQQVEVHITATDLGGSGVNKILYIFAEDREIARIRKFNSSDSSDFDTERVYDPENPPRISKRFKGKVLAICLDNAGNLSEPKQKPVTVEDTLPTATHTLSTTDWTDGTVTIRLKAQDDLSGVANITLPDGTVVDGDTAEFTVSTNGTYRFIVADKCGNILNYDVEVKNIDLTPCTVTHTLNPIGYTNASVEINVIAEDLESGVKSITLPDGTVVDGNTASYTVDANSTYTFKLTNNAGTTTNYDVVVDKIDKVNPTITKFELRETQDSPVKQFFRNLLPNSNMFTKQVELIVEAEDDYSGIDKIEYQVVQKGAQLLDSGWTPYRGGEKPSRLKEEMDATVYVRSLDNATNMSAVVSKDAIIDGTAPTATFTLSTTDWVKDGLDITVKAKDNIVGVASITLPDGTVVDGDSATYRVTSNGAYTFVVTDKLGTSTTYTVTVSNIEEQLPTAPTVDGDKKQEWSRTPTKLIFKSSAQSGIKEYQYQIIKKDAANGNWLISSNGEIVVDKEGIFDVIVRSVSVAGNTSLISKYTVKNDFTPPIVMYETTADTIKLTAKDNLSGVAKIVCRHGESLGNEVICLMLSTEKHIYTVIDNAGNPLQTTVDYIGKDSESGGSSGNKDKLKPIIETETEQSEPIKKKPSRPRNTKPSSPDASEEEQENSSAVEQEIKTTSSAPEVVKPKTKAPETSENQETPTPSFIVRLLSSFVQNTAEMAQNLWSWLLSLPMLLCIGVVSLWLLLLALIIYLIYKRLKKNKEKKADKQD